MKPNPFCTLKNFTVPVAIIGLPVLHNCSRRATRLTDIRVWGDLKPQPGKGSVARQTENLVVAVPSAGPASESRRRHRGNRRQPAGDKRGVPNASEYRLPRTA